MGRSRTTPSRVEGWPCRHPERISFCSSNYSRITRERRACTGATGVEVPRVNVLSCNLSFVVHLDAGEIS